MKQIDIDRHNKGQDEHQIEYICSDGNVFFTDKFICKNIYQLLIDPKYGWREMFDKDPDYQREFGKWLDDNSYGVIEDDKIYLWDKNGCGESFPIKPTPQMLTGYILEFMQERMK